MSKEISNLIIKKCHDSRTSISIINVALESSRDILLNLDLEKKPLTKEVKGKIRNVINNAIEETVSLECFVNLVSDNQSEL